MKLKVLALLIVMCALLAWSQVARAQAGPEQYIGEVDATNVYVRHNASMAAYPCTKLSRPQKVTVVGERDDWLMILPPPGVFCVISKQYVKAAADGKTGVVTGDRVWVRAGGDERQTNFTGLQTQLNSADKVKILGEVDTWYKIVPPRRTRFFISSRYVKRVPSEAAAPAASADEAPAETPAAETPTPAPEASEPAEAAVEAATTAPAAGDASTVETPASEDELTDALAKFRTVEKQLIAEFAKPAAARDLPALVTKFQQLDVPADAHLQPYIDYYVEYVKVAMAKESARKKFDALMRATSASQAQYDIRRTEIEVRDTADRSAVYSGQGVLAESAIYVGEFGTPKRYLLRDAQTGAISAYVEAGASGEALAEHVGKNVGVFGPAEYDKGIQTNIIQAQQVVALGEASVPEPSRARIAPLPPVPVRQPVTPAATPVPATPTPVEPRPEPIPLTPPAAEATEAKPADVKPIFDDKPATSVPKPAAPVEPSAPEPVAPESIVPVPSAETPPAEPDSLPVIEAEPPTAEPVPAKPERPVIPSLHMPEPAAPAAPEIPPAAAPEPLKPVEPKVKPTPSLEPVEPFTPEASITPEPVESVAPGISPVPAAEPMLPAVEPEPAAPAVPAIESAPPSAEAAPLPAPMPAAEMKPEVAPAAPAPTSPPAMAPPEVKLEPLPKLTPARGDPKMISAPIVSVRPASTMPGRMESLPMAAPTTRPAAAKPLPPEGLPVAEPVNIQDAIDEEEYD